KTKAIAISLAVVAGIAAGVILVAKVGSSSSPSAASKPGVDTRVEVGAATAAESKETPVTATSTAAAVPTDQGTAIDVADLPDQDPADSSDAGKTKPRGGRPLPKPGTTVAANVPTATAAAPPPTAKPTAPPTSNGMPAVQDPGF
ncbi:MAG: hypothetical protein JNK04_14110, partial [Myxococcales bacterium]|nr:hypothetical protein [Myxococcales bacterium]